MNYMVVFGVMLVFQEISTTYVAVRWLLYKHNMGRSMAYFMNAFFMFVFFMLGRLVYQIYITFVIAGPKFEAELSHRSCGYFEGMVIAEMFTVCALSIVLNLYWMYLMVKMIIRVMTRGGSQQPSEAE